MSTNRSNARASLCSFTFTDGRQCRTPRAAHPYLCIFHARKDAQALAADAAGKDIAYHLSGAFVSACDLSSALGRLFSAVAQGQVKPKTRLHPSLPSPIPRTNPPLAKHEYINAYGTDTWRDTIRASHEQTANHFADTHLARSPIASSDSRVRQPRRYRAAIEPKSPPPTKNESIPFAQRL